VLVLRFQQACRVHPLGNVPGTMTIDHWKAQLRGVILGEVFRLIRLYFP
jgi:hypothetical protein